MKFRLSVHRKGSVPGSFGSEGPGAELEIELDDDATAQEILDHAQLKYEILEKAVDKQLAKMVAKTEAELAARAKPEPTAPSGARAFQDDRRPAEAPPRRFAEDVPPPSRRRPEPGYDEMDQTQGQESPPPQPQNGYGGRQQQRNGQREDPPKSGAELAGWTKRGGAGEQYRSAVANWGKNNGLSWEFKSWPPDAVAACVHDVTVQTTPRRWGGN